MSDTNDDIDYDDFRTALSFNSLNYAKQLKVINDGLVSVLNNEEALRVKTDDEHAMAKEVYLDTKSAVETLDELSRSLDETDDDEQSVADRWTNEGEG